MGYFKENLVRNRYVFFKDMLIILYFYNKVNKDLYLRNVCVFKLLEKFFDLVYI